MNTLNRATTQGMKSYNTVGLDLSLTSPGLSCLQVGENGNYFYLDFDSCKTTSDEPWHVRIKRIIDTVLLFVAKHKPKRIMIENYSYGSRNGREVAGEVHGSVIFALIQNGFPPENIFRAVSPQSRAKFFTGNGRAVKGDVVRAFNAQFGFNFKVKDNDVVDAGILAFIDYCIVNYTHIEQYLNKDQKDIIKTVSNNKGGF